MIYFNRKSERYALIFFHIIFLSARFIDAAAANDITSQIRECCVKGLQYAKLNENCEKYEYEVSSIPALWRGLCHSSFGFCCSHRLDEVNCKAGQLAAKTGSRCDENLNSSIYSKCCRACQVGLAVNASNLDCNDSLFSFFSGVQSYKECCNGSPHQTDANTPKQNYKKDHLEPITDLEENYGTIVLKDDDDDICGKVPNLCEHICENTKEAYQCKCKPGYVLEENNVTCRLQLISDLLNENITDDGSASDYVDVLDNNNSQTLTTGSCPLGFEYSTTRGKCEDIDECANENNCEFNQYCHNTIGSYHCLKINKSVCKSGYRFNRESQKCEDYDECEDFPCKLGFRCKNFPGGYECKEDSSEAVIGLSRECSEGFQSNNGDCVDIDECKIENPCESNQICVNDLGKYHCECKIGYSLDTTTNGCVDINECSINNHNCLSTQRCDNTVGSYVCTRLQSCGTGYTFNAETNNCDDDDECALKTDNCPPSYECYNTKGSFRCYRKISTTTTSTTTTTTTLRPTTQQTIIRNPLLNIIPRNRLEFNATKNNGRNFDLPYTASNCDLGFYRNSLGACVDINECVVGHPCGSHQKCINTNGSYRCINLLECSAGFRASPDGSSCKDVDECETGEHNCADNQICQNKIGGYICSCPAGHQLARTAGGVNRCIDINECGQSQNICPSNSLCRNTIGSYFCECKPGFQKNHQNDRFCEDVDECQTIPELCQQKCINFWGGYRCSCNTGYELGPDNRTCNDVDECEVHKSYKPCMGYCNNIPGSYECSCPRGYTLALDKTTCRDIDECSSGAFCTGRNDICTNIRGSYRCTTIHCPYGYINDPDQKNRCRQISSTCDGEDCYNKPSAYTYNFITLTSKSIIPPDGRTIFSLRGPHWYDDTDFDLKILKIQAAANIEKATENHFETFKEKHIVNLILKRSLEGPQDIELELSMTVFSNGMPRGKSVAKIFIIVSQYEF